MPVTEETSYNLATLHKAFAASAIALFLATVVVLVIDHRREWKTIQRTADRIELQVTQWRKAQQRDEEEGRSTDPQDRLLAAKRSTYFDFHGIFPWPGKKWLELPILDALNSPRRIDNLWNENLDQELGSFGRVQRFDRCTTCHQLIQKTLPDTADEAAYPREFTFDVWLNIPDERPTSLANANASSSPLEFAVEEITGIRFAAHGLVSPRDVTVAFVRRQSSAATARIRRHTPVPQTARLIRSQLFHFKPDCRNDISPGLIVGDVITAIEAQPLPASPDASPDASPASRWAVLEQLLAAGTSHWEAIQRGDEPPGPLRVTIRRGLPNPYASHPRLDLFVGSQSPHKLSEFACTVCHEGQGSATAFKWASHTPNSLETASRWWKDHDWFDNHDWEFPMWPRRFAQSACLKCHHDVTELEPSKRFPTPPAPKVVRGHTLIRHFGCFGCHEINGFDDAQRRIGPDLRLEPNYYAAALQFQGVPNTGYENLTDLERGWIDQLIADPQRDSVRQSILAMFREDRSQSVQPIQDTGGDGDGDGETPQNDIEAPRFSDYVHQTLEPLLNDQPAPGTMRKVGPSLRFVANKLDHTFLVDWIRRPTHFRPNTKMPHPFGQWNHLPTQSLTQQARKLQAELARLESGERSNQNNRIQNIKAQLHQLQQELKGEEAEERRFEPIEILSIAAYLLERSQPYEPIAPPSGISPTKTEAERRLQIERGRIAFEERGCLACHEHQDFPNVENYRDTDDLAQGPDLSAIAAKFAPIPNPNSSRPNSSRPNSSRPNSSRPNSSRPNSSRWLYSWIKQPTQYDARTVMPDLALDPVEHHDNLGNVVSISDPVADIVAYLLAGPTDSWAPAKELVLNLDQEQEIVLEELAGQYLQGTFAKPTAARFLQQGIPANRHSALQGAEIELVVGEDEKDTVTAEEMTHKRLMYVAKKTLVRYGCFGCHDIPGLEDAKPIGPALSDWGRKDPTQLAFNHILQYVAPENLPPYYSQQLRSASRIGFAFQKLSEPRSFDYRKTNTKPYTDRLRMPRFPLTVQQREEIVTFVLGLVADPPTEALLYSPDRSRAAILNGKRILDKYNCRACHIFEMEEWKIAYEPGYFGDQGMLPTYPFVLTRFQSDQRSASCQVDSSGLRHAVIEGMPSCSNDGMPVIYDDEDFPIQEEPNEEFELDKLVYAFDLWRPALLDGSPYQVGEAPVNILAKQIQQRIPSSGGALAKYLLPHIVRRQNDVTPDAKGAEAWGWLPPSLVNEGSIVQTDWLFNYLLDPYEIRPAVTMRMPRFNLSRQEARRLVDFFAAVAHSDFPYHTNESRQREHLAMAEDEYATRLAQLGEINAPQTTRTKQDRYLIDAMKILTDKNYCVTCHLIGDFRPTGLSRTLAPDLADVYRRLRADYVRKWIARPAAIQPFTSMPINIPYDPDSPFLGSSVSQNLFHGTSIDQVESLVDLLMNFDRYARQQMLLPETNEAQ